MAAQVGSKPPTAIRGSGGFEARQIPSPPVADGKEWIAADVVVGNPERSIQARNRTFSMTFREAPGHGGDVERFKLFLQRGRDAAVQIDVNLTSWAYVTPDDRWVFTEPLYALDVREWKQYPLFDVLGIPNYTELESISKDGRRLIVSRSDCAYDCRGLPRYYYEVTLPK